MVEDNINDANEGKMSLMRNHMALSLLVFLGRSYLYRLLVLLFDDSLQVVSSLLTCSRGTS